MMRRAVIALLGGVAAAWPLTPHAQETANVTIATEPHIEVAQVKSAEKMLANPRLSERLVDLMKGFSLSGADGIGSAWASYIVLLTCSTSDTGSGAVSFSRLKTDCPGTTTLRLPLHARLTE